MELQIPVQDLFCLSCSQQFNDIDSFQNHHKNHVHKPIVIKLEIPSDEEIVQEEEEEEDEVINENKNSRNKSKSLPSTKIVPYVEAKQVKPTIVNKSKQIVQKSSSSSSRQAMTKPGPLSKKLESKAKLNEIVAVKQNSRIRLPSPDPVDEIKCIQNDDLISIRCNVCDKHFFSLKKFLAHLKIAQQGKPTPKPPPPSALKPQQSIKVQTLHTNKKSNNNQQDEDSDGDNNYGDDGFDNCPSPFSPNLDDLLKENDDPMDINLEDESIQNLITEETRNVKSSSATRRTATRPSSNDKKIKQKISTTTTTISASSRDNNPSTSQQNQRKRKSNDDDEMGDGNGTEIVERESYVENDNDDSDDNDGYEDDDKDGDYHPYIESYHKNLNGKRQFRKSSKPNFVSTVINDLPLIIDETIALSCPKCKRKFESIDYLKRHWKRQKIIKCDYCDDFNDVACLYHKVHIRKHQKKHKCEICLKFFGRPAHLRDHMLKHTKERPYICDVEHCTERFARKKALEDHHLKVHSGQEPEFSCDFPGCNRLFFFEYLMREHKKHHSPDRNYKCTGCEKTFKTKSSMREHATVHQTPEEWTKICPFPTCGLAFRTSSALAKHRKTHIDAEEIPITEEGFQCGECQRNYKTPEALEIHVKQQCSSFPCPKKKCNKQFMSRGLLNQHVRCVHLKVEQVVCDQCGKTFSRRGDLQRHLKLHEGDRPYACQYCGKTFAQKIGCQMHEKIHTQDRRYCCNFCGRKFIQPFTLTRHLQCHTGEKPFVHHCGAAFPDLRPLKKHKLTCTVPEPEHVSSSEDEDELENFKMELEQAGVQQLPPLEPENNEIVEEEPAPQFFIL